jgi:hypothetical protein
MSKLAIRYHDKSVLEQHHIAVTFKILRDNNKNILLNFEMGDAIKVRKFCINNILATDIKEHFQSIKEFSSRFLNKIDLSHET